MMDLDMDEWWIKSLNIECVNIDHGFTFKKPKNISSSFDAFPQEIMKIYKKNNENPLSIPGLIKKLEYWDAKRHTKSVSGYCSTQALPRISHPDQHIPTLVYYNNEKGVAVPVMEFDDAYAYPPEAYIQYLPPDSAIATKNVTQAEWDIHGPFKIQQNSTDSNAPDKLVIARLLYNYDEVQKTVEIPYRLSLFNDNSTTGLPLKLIDVTKILSFKDRFEKSDLPFLQFVTKSYPTEHKAVDLGDILKDQKIAYVDCRFNHTQEETDNSYIFSYEEKELDIINTRATNTSVINISAALENKGAVGYYMETPALSIPSATDPQRLAAVKALYTKRQEEYAAYLYTSKNPSSWSRFFSFSFWHRCALFTFMPRWLNSFFIFRNGPWV